MTNNEEPCFPRGRPKPTEDKGVSKKERTRDNEEKDYLFGKKNERKEKPSLKKGPSDHSDEKPVVVAEEDDLPVTLKAKNVEYLSYKKIQPGALVLGQVRSTEEFELTVSLPFSMIGVVKAPNVLTAYTAALTEELNSAGTIKSKSLNDIFYVGQSLVCKVMNVIPQKCFIQLTVDPKEVNENLAKSNLKKGMVINGCVTSEEDHGYVVDVGMSSTKAFLSKKAMDSEKDESFGQWSNVRCVILDVKSNGSIIQLSNDCRKVNKSMDEKDMIVEHLQPGCLVKCSLVKAVEGQGEIVKFGELQGSIALSSLSDKQEKEEDEKEEEEKSKEEKSKESGPKSKKRKKKQQRKDIFSDNRRVACISYVSNEKLICLTDKCTVWNENKRFEHLQKLRVDYPKMKVLNKVKVTARIKGIGIMVELEKGISGVCLMRNLFDKQDQLNEEKFKVGNFVQARVLDNMTLDGAVDVGCKKSILIATVLSFEDLQAGDKVQAKILAVNPNGLQVLLGSKQDGEFRSNGSVRGFVPSLHLSDIVLKQPAKFFNESDIITCRVLSVDAAQRKLRLTHKPTLVKLKQPDVISDFHQLKVGAIVQTYITAIIDAGCIMKMFDQVRGLVTRKDIESDMTTNMEKDYYVGQVIKCRVVSCDPDAEKLILSFRLKPTANSTNGKAAANKLEPQIVEVKVVGKEEESLKVEILNVVGAGAGKLVGDMSMMHLSDDPSDAEAKYNKIEIGQKLSGCALITTRPLKVSMKQSLVDFITNSEQTLTVSEFVADRLLPGYVANVAEYGVFVRFVGGVTALCPKSMLTDRYVKSTGGLFEIDQSVTACVKENNEQTNKLVVSLRPSECHVETKEESESKEKIEEYMTSQEALRAEWKISVGDVLVLKRKEEAEEEAAMMECLLVNDHPNADKMEISLIKTATPPTTNADGNIEAVVFDVQPNSDTCKVLVSSAPLVVAAYKSKKKMPKFAPSSIRCEGVVLSRDDVATCCYITEVVHQKSLSGKIVVFLHQANKNAASTSDEKVSFFLLKTGPQNRYLLGRDSKEEVVAQRVVMKNATNGNNLLLTAGRRVHPREVEVGTQVTGKVKSVRHTHVILHMSSLPLTKKGKPVMGRIHFSQTDISHFNDGDFPLRKMKAGEEMTCRVIGHRTIKSHTFLDVTRNDAVNVMLELSMLPADSTNEEMSLRKRHPIGSIVKACVRDNLKSNSKDPRDVARFAVEVSPNVEAFVSLLTANTKKVIKGDRSDVRPGMLMKCYVADHPGKNRLTLVREGAVISDVGSGYEIKNSCELNGKVCEIVNDGLLVKCPFGSKGKLNITDLSDEFTDNPLEQYITKNSYIRCRVLDCSSLDRMILTMRCGGDNIRDPVVCDVTQLKSGQKIRGFVKTFSKMGIFVVLSREVTGRVTFKNASKYYINDDNRQRAAEVFKPGKLLLCCVLSVKDGKVDLSLLEKDTGSEDNLPEEWALPMRNKPAGEKRKNSTKSAEAKKRKRSEKESGESMEAVLEELENTSTNKPSKIIEFSKRTDTEEDKEVIGFNWNKEEDKMEVTDDEDNNDEDDNNEAAAKKRKLNKKKEAELQKESKEQDIRAIEDRLAKESEDFEPKTADEWKRKIVANPHDSELWIKFMTFHVYSTEFDQARAVAEEALKTIEFGMVEERLNVWIAMINMEIMYGENDETVDTMIERALKHNDQLKVYNHLITIYIKRNEHEKAEELHKKVAKKFRLNEQVWTAYIRYLTEQNRFDDAHDILKRSLQSINQKSHIRFMSLFARLCLASSSETMRGVNIFEKILNEFPKRGDVWSQYLQALESNDLIEETRKAFERIIETPMSSKKSKSFFKRYLAFEEKHGTQAALKQKSLEYIARFGKQEED